MSANPSFHQFESGGGGLRRSRHTSPVKDDSHGAQRRTAPQRAAEPVQCIISSGDEDDDDFHNNGGAAFYKQSEDGVSMWDRRYVQRREESGDRSSERSSHPSPSAPAAAAESSVPEESKKNKKLKPFASSSLLSSSHPHHLRSSSPPSHYPHPPPIQFSAPVCVSSDDEISSSDGGGEDDDDDNDDDDVSSDDGSIDQDAVHTTLGGSNDSGSELSSSSSAAAVEGPLLSSASGVGGAGVENAYKASSAASDDPAAADGLASDLKALFLLFRHASGGGSGRVSAYSSPRTSGKVNFPAGRELNSREKRTNGRRGRQLDAAHSFFFEEGDATDAAAAAAAGVPHFLQDEDEGEDGNDDGSSSECSSDGVAIESEAAEASLAAGTVLSAPPLVLRADEVDGEEDEEDSLSVVDEVDAEAERISMTLTQLGVTPGGGGCRLSASAPESPLRRERSLSNLISAAGSGRNSRHSSRRRHRGGQSPTAAAAAPPPAAEPPEDGVAAATREAIAASRARLLAQSQVLCEFLKSHPKVDADAFCLALQDCYTRFVLNLPLEYLSRSVHVCFAIQEAYWWYCDLWVERTGAALPKLSMEAFGILLVECCPVLRLYFGNRDCGHLLAEWRAYSRTIPLRGAVILDAKLSHAIFVQSWKGGRWMFPRGKVDEGETDVRCAVREMKEELGIDLEGLLNPRIYIDCLLEGQSLRLYIVPGILEVTPFGPRKRKEIGDIRWIPLKALPNWPSPPRGPIKHPPSYLYKFWATEAFVQALHGWVTLLRKGSVNRLQLHKYATKQQQRDHTEWTEVKNHKFGYKLPPDDYNEQLLQRYRVMIRTDRPASLVNAQFSRSEIPQLIRFCREKNLPEIEHLLRPQRQLAQVDSDGGDAATTACRTTSKKAKQQRRRKKGSSGARNRRIKDSYVESADDNAAEIDRPTASPRGDNDDEDDEEEDLILSLSDIAHQQPAKATIGPLPPFLSVNRLYQIPLETPRHVIRALQRPQLQSLELATLATALGGGGAQNRHSSLSAQPPPLRQKQQRSIVNDLRKVGMQVGSQLQPPPVPKRVILRRGSNLLTTSSQTVGAKIFAVTAPPPPPVVPRPQRPAVRPQPPPAVDNLEAKRQAVLSLSRRCKGSKKDGSAAPPAAAARAGVAENAPSPLPAYNSAHLITQLRRLQPPPTAPTTTVGAAAHRYVASSLWQP